MLGRGTSAGTVAQTLRAFHRTDECRLLQKTIAAHPAAEQRTLYAVFQNLQEAVHKLVSLEGRIGRLPSSTRSKSGHSHSKLKIVYNFCLLILASFEMGDSVFPPTVDEGL
jgi:hypothetical protein